MQIDGNHLIFDILHDYSTLYRYILFTVQMKKNKKKYNRSLHLFYVPPGNYAKTK